LKEITQTFSQPEIIPVRCDVHGWMGGWIFVAANPYFDVTAADGTFKLAAVAPGKYLVEVWHETLGVQTRQIQVDANQSANAFFEFAAK
jgi:hypothetical protein